MNRKRLLIVDDEQLVHDVVARIFRRRIEIVRKLSAEQALDDLESELASGAFDIVLLDVRIPGVPDGVDFFRHIQQIDAAHRPPVIFMTGEDHIAPTLGGTMKTPCLAKPFSVTRLREAMAEYLGGAPCPT